MPARTCVIPAALVLLGASCHDVLGIEDVRVEGAADADGINPGESGDADPGSGAQLAIEPEWQELGVADSTTLTATYVAPSGASHDVTDQASWSSSDTETVTVWMGPGGEAFASGASAGEATIQARYEGLSAGADIVVRSDLDAVTWVSLPSGTFEMGSDDDQAFGDEQPVREVTLSAFALAETETTVAQYEVCVDQGACEEPARDYDNNEAYNWGAPDRHDHPINGVTWFQAQNFCESAGWRLPTEAEREYAATSGGLDRRYPWGDEEASCERAVMDDSGEGCGEGGTWPVCSKPEGHSEQGICDLAGNVWEWVYDWYGDYPSESQVDPTGPEEGSDRVRRGGSWNLGARLLRAPFRVRLAPSEESVSLGFRCARPL